MDIVSQYILISFIVALEFAIVIGQAILISRIHRYTAPWVLMATAFLLIGGRQVWTMLKIPIQVQELRTRGIELPPVITLEQWLLIVTSMCAGVLFIVAFDILRRRYSQLGI